MNRDETVSKAEAWIKGHNLDVVELASAKDALFTGAMSGDGASWIVARALAGIVLELWTQADGEISFEDCIAEALAAINDVVEAGLGINSPTHVSLRLVEDEQDPL